MQLVGGTNIALAELAVARGGLKVLATARRAGSVFALGTRCYFLLLGDWAVRLKVFELIHSRVGLKVLF